MTYRLDRAIQDHSWRKAADTKVAVEPSPTWAETKADCVGADLPGAEQPADDPLCDRATAEQALAKVTTERNALLVAESTLSKIAAALAIPALEPHDDALSMVKRLVDGYTVVSQRLAGSQKEVAEVSAERDEATARATKAEARVKRLRKSINAAHDVLDEAAIGLEPEGSPRWTLARRCRTLTAEIWDHLDAVNAIDEIAKVIDLIPPSLSSGAADGEVVARVKALRNDDDTRAAIAVAVGLDDSASLGLILDTVKGKRPPLEITEESWAAATKDQAQDAKLTAYGTLAALLFADRSDPPAVVKALHALNNRIKVYEITEEQWEADNATSVDLERLVNYHQAPIAFSARPLTLAERAAFVIRRLWQGRMNAANEAAALRRELGDISDALGDLSDTAAREPIGDREEHLGLSTAERIRLAFTH